MREEWHSRTLSEVCLIKPPKSEARRKVGESDLVSFVPMEHLGINQKIVEPRTVRTLGEVAGSYTYFAENDVLMAKITPCFENGKLGIVRGLTNGVGFGSSEYIVFRPNDKLISDYLYYFLMQDSFRSEGIKTMSGAVGHKRVSKDFIERCPIPIPPLHEQERIVAILDEALTGLAEAAVNAERNLKNARDLFYRYLNLVFDAKGDGWNHVCIADVCDAIVDCPNRTAPKLDVSSSYKMIRTTNVRNGRVSLDSVNYVSEETYRRWTRRQKPQRGDVLLTREAPLGEVGMICSDENVFLGQRLVSYRANPDRLDSRFLLFALQSSDLKQQIKEFGSGATVQHMRVPDSKALMLSLPSLLSQRRISEKLDGIWNASDCLATNYRQKLEQLRQLKQSILRTAFSGKLSLSLSIPYNLPEAAE
jgi:type I restriction enzyme S subunit